MSTPRRPRNRIDTFERTAEPSRLPHNLFAKPRGLSGVLGAMVETHYAKSGDLRIAYQVVGKGPLDLVFVPGFISNLDHYWDEPNLVHFISRLSTFSRLVLFDKRGTGLSDRVGNLPTLEE